MYKSKIDNQVFTDDEYREYVKNECAENGWDFSKVINSPDEDFEYIEDEGDQTKQEEKSMILEWLDWVEFHKLMAFSQAGDKVIVWDDGTISTMDSGTYPNPEIMDKIVHIYHPCGMGNTDFSVYFDGWGTRNEDGDVIVDDTSEVMDFNDALVNCIENGDFTDWIEAWKSEALRVDENAI